MSTSQYNQAKEMDAEKLLVQLMIFTKIVEFERKKDGNYILTLDVHGKNFAFSSTIMIETLRQAYSFLYSV